MPSSTPPARALPTLTFVPLPMFTFSTLRIAPTMFFLLMFTPLVRANPTFHPPLEKCSGRTDQVILIVKAVPFAAPPSGNLDQSMHGSRKQPIAKKFPLGYSII